MVRAAGHGIPSTGFIEGTPLHLRKGAFHATIDEIEKGALACTPEGQEHRTRKIRVGRADEEMLRVRGTPTDLHSPIESTAQVSPRASIAIMERVPPSA